MPTYEYEFLEDGHRFEEFQSITDAPVDDCPVCGGKVRRLISGGAGILFKGSGFYQTDYRSDSYRKAAKADRESSGKDSGSEKSSSKSDGSKSGGSSDS
jgi:putative FmdB family regulatory protein